MATENDVTAPLREAFARRTGTSPDDWFCTFKARYGMREVFSGVREVLGAGNVVTTLFTGCTAVDSILSAGMAARYAQVADATLSIDGAALELGDDDRAVLLQNSYGMIDAAVTARIAAKAHGAGAILVEDSAHCLSRMARGADGSPIADVSVHSFGIEKTFSDIYFGGAIWVSPDMANRGLRDAIVRNLAACADLPARIGRACGSYRTHARILAHLPGTLSRAAKAVLLGTGSYEPPVADVERRGELPYPSYLPNGWMVERILPRFATLDDDEAARRECVRRYVAELGSREGLWVPAAALGCASDQPLLRFPVVLPDAEAGLGLVARLGASGLYAVRWYHVPFFPGALDVTAYGLAPDDDRLATYHQRFSGVVGLPCDMGPERVGEVIDIVSATIS